MFKELFRVQLFSLERILLLSFYFFNFLWSEKVTIKKFFDQFVIFDYYPNPIFVCHSAVDKGVKH